MPAGLALPGSVAAGPLGSTTTTVYVIVVVLVAVGLAMIAVAVWLVRATRRDHVVLGPLERMGDRSWRKHDAQQRRRELDEVRPPGAPAPVTRAARPPAAAGPAPPVSRTVAVAPGPPAGAHAGPQAKESPVGDEAPPGSGADAATTDGSVETAPADHDSQSAQQTGSPSDRDSTPTGSERPFLAHGDREADG